MDAEAEDMSQRTRTGRARPAGHVLARHGGAVMGLGLWQLAVRAVALLPLAAALFGIPGLKLGRDALPWCAGATVLLNVFLVMPLRGYGYSCLRFLSGGHRARRGWYAVYLRYGLCRLGQGLLWGLPFLAVSGLWLYAFNGMPMTSFYAILTRLSRMVNGQLDAGVMVWIGAMGLTGLLLCYGWWRLMPADQVDMQTRGVRKGIRRGRRVRSENRKAYWANALVNMLLTLPGLAGFCYVLLNRYLGGVSWDQGAFMAAQRIMVLLAAPLPNTTLLYLAAVLVLVHLPLCMVRKVRNAALTRRLYEAKYYADHAPSGRERAQ